MGFVLSPVREQGLVTETVDMKMNFKKGLMSPLTSGNSLSYMPMQAWEIFLTFRVQAVLGGKKQNFSASQRVMI